MSLKKKAPLKSGAFLDTASPLVDQDYLMPLELHCDPVGAAGDRPFDSHHRAVARNLHAALDNREQEVDRDGRVYLWVEIAIKEGAGKTDIAHQRS